MPADTMGMVETVIADIRKVHGARWFDAAAEEFWTVILNRFAADVVEQTLPRDLSAQIQVITKAQELGIDIGRSAAAFQQQVGQPRWSAEIKQFPTREP